jgi:hypothetical protein
LIFFIGLCYVCALIGETSKEGTEEVVISTGDKEKRGGKSQTTITLGADDTTKFSRTLGREKLLDEMLDRITEKERRAEAEMARSN